MAEKIYLDNAATTKVDERVLKAMLPFFDKEYGNASSFHDFGRKAKIAIENARMVIAKSINASPEEIYFTSGGTESNNWALKELFFDNSKNGKRHIITTKIEHPSILEVCKMLEKFGAKITYLDVDKEGKINLEDLEKAINSETLLVSIIQGNNEIGTLQEIEKIGRICRQKKVFFHIDACQSYTKTELDVIKHDIGLMTLNSHKIHGPKGIGALFIREGINLMPLFNGGGHERGL
jgi:cysteine desulfurase